MIPPSSVDSSLLELFRAELDTHLPALSEGLLALERQPGQTSPLAGLMRAAHSIKGAAKIVGVPQAVRAAHALEDCFVAAQEGRIALGSDAVDVLLRGVDALQRITTPGVIFSEDDLDRLLEDLAAVRGGRAPARTAGPPTLRPAGDLDAAAAEELRPRLAALLRGGAAEICLDLAAVRQVSPEGLALLAAVAARAGSTALTVVNVAADVRLLLEMTGLGGAYRLPEGR